MILDGILVQPYGINCDAKILDTILRKQMIISVKTTTEKRNNYQLSILKNPLKISNIKANGFKVKGWKQICCFSSLDVQSCPTLLRPLWNHPGKVTALGCHALLPGISPSQESKSCLCISFISGRFFTVETTGKLWKH